MAMVETAEAPHSRTLDRAAAFEAAYRQHAAAVYRFALRCVGRRDLAEDLTSEAFLALHRSLDSIDLAQLPSWLFRVVRNRAIDHWRRLDVERRHAPVVEEPTAETALLEFKSLVQSRSLKPVHRLCLVLRYLHGMTRTEVAERLGLSETQVKGHLQYALGLLRRELQESAR